MPAPPADNPSRVEPRGAFNDAPGTGGLSPTVKTTGEACLLCGEPGPDVPVNGGAAGFHRECFLFTVIGHAVGVCGCTGYPRPGQTVREAARLACSRFGADPHE